MNDIQLLVVQLQNEIDNMTESLYQQNDMEGYKKLDGIISVITELLQKHAVLQAQTGTAILDENKILGNLSAALAAMEQKDRVLFADIFHFEIREQLNLFLNE